MKEVTIESETYIVPENINYETNTLLLLEEFNESKIRYHRNMVAVLTKAKRAYIASLKQDILKEKAGMDFLE